MLVIILNPPSSIMAFITCFRPHISYLAMDSIKIRMCLVYLYLPVLHSFPGT